MLDLFDIKKSWRTKIIVIWALISLRITILVYEIDLDPNEHIIDWIKFIMVSFVFLIPFTVLFLFIWPHIMYSKKTEWDWTLHNQATTVWILLIMNSNKISTRAYCTRICHNLSLNTHVSIHSSRHHPICFFDVVYNICVGVESAHHICTQIQRRTFFYILTHPDKTGNTPYILHTRTHIHTMHVMHTHCLVA